MLRLLRRAADHGLELACDSGEDVRARVLIAARTVDTFYPGRPTALQLAALADDALGWREPPSDRPCTLDALAEQLVALGEVRELIEVRDRALRHAELLLDPEGRR